MRNQNIKDMKRDLATAATRPFFLIDDFSKDVKKNLAFGKDQINARLNQLAQLNIGKKEKATAHQIAQSQARFSSK